MEGLLGVVAFSNVWVGHHVMLLLGVVKSRRADATRVRVESVRHDAISRYDSLMFIKHRLYF